MARSLFQVADIPGRLIPAAIVLGTSTFTMSALPGTPAIQNAIPMPFFGTTPFAAPGLGIIASLMMLGFGLWWLQRAETAARKAGEGFGSAKVSAEAEAVDDAFVRERATAAREFDPAEIRRGHISDTAAPILWAMLPLVIVVVVNLLMSIIILPKLDLSFLSDERWAGASLSSVGGVWSVAVALATAVATVVIFNRSRLPALRESMDAGANASVLPAFGVASLVGFGAVVAELPGFTVVREWVLSIGGGPLASLAVAVSVLASLTGSASGGMTIALDALGETYMRLAAEANIDPGLLHRVATISAGTLDSLPHNGAVVSLLAVCGQSHRESYFDMVMVGIIGAVLGLLAVILLGSAFGSF